jgi:hypothetical protein
MHLIRKLLLDDGMDGIGLAHDHVQWQVFLLVVLNFKILLQKLQDRMQELAQRNGIITI